MSVVVLFGLAMMASGQPGLPEIIRLRPPPPAAAAEAEAPAQAEAVEAPEAAPEEPKQPKPAGPSRASLVGEWTLGLARRNARCRLTLSGAAAGQGFYIASLGYNCPLNLFAISRWGLTEDGLVLASRTGKPLARLQPKDGGQSGGFGSAWQGPGDDGSEVVIMRASTR